jgi:hypothetical protein
MAKSINESMTKSPKLVRISQAEGLPLKKSTLYKWRHLNKHPGLFVKLGRALFIDMNVLDEVIEAGRV